MVKTQWMLYTRRGEFQALSSRFSISPIVAKIMVNRGVEEKDFPLFLQGGRECLHSGQKLKGAMEAARILREKISAGKKIRVVGDYDIDGVCSSYILIAGLKTLGANVDGVIPHRVKDGYGINESIIRQAAEEGVDTLLTCDNGIAAYEALALGKQLGMTLLVTDHHEVQKNERGEDLLPEADVIVNPRQKDCTYPFPGICGAFVAYKLMELLFMEQVSDWEREWQRLGFMEMAAIATVGDVMSLTGENRVLVRQGLKALEQTQNPGLVCLMEVTGLLEKELTPYHIGFVLGPCLNAGGRLETAQAALGLLLCENREQAMEKAVYLKLLNDKRKELTRENVEQALLEVEEKYRRDKVLVVYLEHCHESIAGIIAGRVREYFGKPAIILCPAEQKDMAKGSARSIEAYNIFEALCQVKNFLPKFGGHPMAAGMSILKKDVPSFRQALNQRAKLTEEDFIEKVWIDVALPFSYVSRELIQELNLLAPFGNGNEKPKFAQKDVQVLSLRLMGQDRNTAKLLLRGSDGCEMEGIVFGAGEALGAQVRPGDRMDVIYYPQENVYRGHSTLQLVISHWKCRNLP